MQFPSRYEPVEKLGKGGAGEVWSARDRVTDRLVALKLLREGAAEPEIMALVREATHLSGIEGLGVPRVLHFGRLPGSGRAFMVRELVAGRSLADILAAPGAAPEACLRALVHAAQLLARLHRALLLHGDVKPANIIVADDYQASLVDLGLAAPWQDGATMPAGLTPRYAAPELLRGEGLTPQAEVFALGASAQEVLDKARALPERLRAPVQKVVRRAMAELEDNRQPSVDEFAEELAQALGIEVARQMAVGRAWGIRGIDELSALLLAEVRGLSGGSGLLLSGAVGSGRSTLMRRLAWSLGVAGVAVALVEGDAPDLELALCGHESVGSVLIIDDADRRTSTELVRLDQLREAGAVLVMVVSNDADVARFPGKTFSFTAVPPLADDVSTDLVRRSIPSLSDKVVEYIVQRAAGVVGELRQIVDRLAEAPVVGIEDVERLLADTGAPSARLVDVAQIHEVLDRGLYDQASEYLSAYAGQSSLLLGVARAKLATGQGRPREAIRSLEAVENELSEAVEQAPAWFLEMARAQLRTGQYDAAEKQASEALNRVGATLLGEIAVGDGAQSVVGSLVAEAMAVSGLAQSLRAQHEQAAETLRRSVSVARGSGSERTLALALGSLAFALQRDDRLDEAQAANEEALALAESAGDAGHVATTRLNLGGIARMRGDLAETAAHLEAAVDMGRRSGRASTVRQALLNLANLDLYLGRQARARGSIEALAADRDALGKVQRAQLLALESEAAALAGDFAGAEDKCALCAVAYQKLGRPVDAAEAQLEGVLFALRTASPDLVKLQGMVEGAEEQLAASGAHRPLLLEAVGRLAQLAGAPQEAHDAFELAVAAAEQGGQREWQWRALEARSQAHAALDDAAASEQDHVAAVAVLEAIAAELPRDLREVYYNDPRRRALRGARRTVAPPLRDLALGLKELEGATQLAGIVQHDSMARILEINRELAGEYDLDRVLERVTDHGVALLRAERGFVLLKSKSGAAHLSIHAARDSAGDEPHRRFSTSIAERVVESGAPFVALNAPADDRVSEYVSVHSLTLKSVACVPIRSRGGVIGALYVETRLHRGEMFEREVPTLAVLADQAAIAIESARLVGENQQRTKELEESNRQLEQARAKLEELLGRRTEQLQSTRADLRSVRAVIRGHFGYQGIVGTSAAMRRVYAIVDRVKDTDVPVLLTGESGTGKEVIARAIHKAGPRAKGKMVGLNCGAIPEHLLESELFGHVRGAFTGAERDRKGLFRELDGGTILLDEIGDMPAQMQAGLLRVLQEKVVRPVGGTKEVAVNTRVIAATHRNLEEMVRSGEFREDLYYRLHVIEICAPPLRERTDDIPILVDHFLRIFAARYERERRTVSREAIAALASYHWPGNVRQLENVLLNAWILSDAPELSVSDFQLPESPAATPVSGVAESPARVSSAGDAKDQERVQILEALDSCNWNRAKAAELIGMPRRTFYRRLKRYGIQ